MSPTVPPDLGDEHVRPGELGEPVHAALDLVGDVRDDLHGAAQVVAAALLGDHGVVDAAGGDVGVALDELVQEALVVAQVEVGLGAVLGDEHLAVLERAHGARIDVDVRVELLARDLEPALFEQPADGRRGDALAEPADDAAGDEDVLGHAPCALLVSIPPFRTQPSSNAPVAATRKRTRGTADLHKTSGGFCGAGVLPVRRRRAGTMICPASPRITSASIPSGTGAARSGAVGVAAPLRRLPPRAPAGSRRDCARPGRPGRRRACGRARRGVRRRPRAARRSP